MRARAVVVLNGPLEDEEVFQLAVDHAHVHGAELVLLGVAALEASGEHLVDSVLAGEAPRQADLDRTIDGHLRGLVARIPQDVSVLRQVARGSVVVAVKRLQRDRGFNWLFVASRVTRLERFRLMRAHRTAHCVFPQR